MKVQEICQERAKSILMTKYESLVFGGFDEVVALEIWFYDEIKKITKIDFNKIMAEEFKKFSI